MNWAGCDIVEMIPGKVSGVPLVRGSRVPADFILENYESGESVSQIAYNFGLDSGVIEKVLDFARLQSLSQSA